MTAAWTVIELLAAAIIGAMLFDGLVHLRHWPYRPIRKWEDELVEKEIVEATQWAGGVDTDAARAYVQGVRTAAIQLGHTTPVFRQERALRRVTRAD